MNLNIHFFYYYKPLVNTGEADLCDVCRELVSIKAKYYQLGVKLGLPPQELDAIRKEDPQDVDQVFTKAILRWLRQEYNITRFGIPTWRGLVEAVGSPAGGNNHALAMDIALKHPVEYHGMPCSCILYKTTAMA